MLTGESTAMKSNTSYSLTHSFLCPSSFTPQSYYCHFPSKFTYESYQGPYPSKYTHCRVFISVLIHRVSTTRVISVLARGNIPIRVLTANGERVDSVHSGCIAGKEHRPNLLLLITNGTYSQLSFYIRHKDNQQFVRIVHK